MTFPLWFTLVGALFVFMALTSTVLRRLPLSSAMLYLGVGAGLAAIGAIRFDPLDGSGFLERITEIAVIISLFTAGLKLRAPLNERRWGAPCGSLWARWR